MGSSTVEMFSLFLSSWRIDEYSVVVLPEPVGPVTSAMPWGTWICCFQISSVNWSKPRSSSCTLIDLVSRIRITTFSP